MAKKEQKAKEQKPKSKKDSSDAKKDKKKLSRKVKIILLIILIILLLGLGVLIFFLVRACQQKEPEKPEETLMNVHVIQPVSDNWKVTVNGKTGKFPVQFGETLNVVVSPKQVEYQRTEYSASDEVIYFAQVSDEDTLTKTWKSSQLYKDGQNYVTSFKMNWNYDIIIQIVSENDYESFIYTADDQGTVVYTYDDTLYDSTKPITRINQLTMMEEYVDRDEFNDNLTIGKNIDVIDKNFLSCCHSFNGNINFQEGGKLQLINDNFLFECTAFNKPINFPETLLEICGDFMYGCSSFNQPMYLNVIYMHRYHKTSFLMGCSNFNSQVVIGKNLKQIPTFFLCDCKKFNQNIKLPDTLEMIGDGFLRNCDNMTSTIEVECKPEKFEMLSSSRNMCVTSNPKALCYLSGIQVSGKYSKAWLETFEDIDDTESNTYRHLIKG